MPCRIKETLILAFVIALLLFYGCTVKITRSEPEVKLPEFIYQSPKDQDYSQAKVALFRFEEPNFFSELTNVNPPEPGYDAAVAVRMGKAARTSRYDHCSAGHLFASDLLSATDRVNVVCFGWQADQMIAAKAFARFTLYMAFLFDQQSRW